MEGSDSARAGNILAGRYRVAQRLGEGGIGVVYEVEHLQIGGRFALKLLKREHLQSSDLVERFRHEAKLGARLRDAHTVAVFDFDTHEGIPFLVMEYLEGLTLQTLLAREGVLSVPRALRLLGGACRGARAAHVLGILHRDLKPSNLFVCQNEHGESCKVLDFGIAKQTDKYLTSSVGPSTSTGAILGTLAYMPPEQIRGEQGLDERADVYSLGAILYECLAGRRLYEAPTPPSLMYKILEEEPVSLAVLRADLPKALVECVERAIRRRPEERFEGVSALHRALLAAGAPAGDSDALALRDDRTESDTSSGERFSPPQASPVPKRSAGRPRTLWIALGAAGLGLLVGRGVVPNAPAASLTSTAPEKPSETSVASKAMLAESVALSALPAAVPVTTAPSAPALSASAPSVAAARRARSQPARPPTGLASAAPSAAPSSSGRDLRTRFDRANPYLHEP